MVILRGQCTLNINTVGFWKDCLNKIITNKETKEAMKFIWSVDTIADQKHFNVI